MTDEQQVSSPVQTLSVTVVTAGKKAQINTFSHGVVVLIYVFNVPVNQTFNSRVAFPCSAVNPGLHPC